MRVRGVIGFCQANRWMSGKAKIVGHVFAGNPDMVASRTSALKKEGQIFTPDVWEFLKKMFCEYLAKKYFSVILLPVKHSSIIRLFLASLKLKNTEYVRLSFSRCERKKN
jgi:hypothetical protein